MGFRKNRSDVIILPPHMTAPPIATIPPLAPVPVEEPEASTKETEEVNTSATVLKGGLVELPTELSVESPTELPPPPPIPTEKAPTTRPPKKSKKQQPPIDEQLPTDKKEET